jgi:hypothetical protein
VNHTASLVLLSVLSAAVGSSAGCVQKSKRAAKAERELLGQMVSNKPPTVQHPLDIRFENKARLIGYDLSAPQMREGQPFTVTWYWQVVTPLDTGWQLFTHLADAKKNNRLNLDAVRSVRNVYPEERWKAGDYIKDSQELTLPGDWNSDQTLFYIGFWKGPKRLRVTSGPQDGKNRALALTVPVGDGKPPEPELPRLIARRVGTAIALDGKLDDREWGVAQPTPSFVQTMTGAPGDFRVEARIAYDARNLYIGYIVADDHLASSFTKHDDHLWEQDAVELMVDPDGDGKNYFEIQVSPAGVVFDTRYDSRRKPLPFGDIDWSSAAVAKLDVHGKLNDDELDEGYSVELAVPWTAFAAGPTPASPPEAGAVWRMNLFVMDARPKGQRAVGWSPPLIGDFHTLERFGRVVFPEAAIPPAAESRTKTPTSTSPAKAPTTRTPAPNTPARAPTRAPVSAPPSKTP